MTRENSTDGLTKRCLGPCRQIKVLDDFDRCRSVADGRQHVCKACRADGRKAEAMATPHVCRRCRRSLPYGAFAVHASGKRKLFCLECDAERTSEPGTTCVPWSGEWTGPDVVRRLKAIYDRKWKCHHTPQPAMAKGHAGNAPTDRDVCDTIRALWWGPKRLRIMARDMRLTPDYRPKATTATDD